MDSKYCASTEEIYHARDLIEARKYTGLENTRIPDATFRLEERIERETGVALTEDMLIMAIVATKGKIIEEWRCKQGYNPGYSRMNIRFAKWLDEELRLNGFPYLLAYRGIDTVPVKDIPVYSISPYSKGIRDIAIVDSTNTYYRNSKITSLMIKGLQDEASTVDIHERGTYRFFFNMTYSASEQEIEEANSAIRNNTEEVNSIRNRLRSEVMVEPTDERVLRVLLAKKICLLPRDVRRGIYVQNNPDEQRFVVWYNKELMRNGFPFSMQYVNMTEM